MALGYWSGGQRATPGCWPVISKRSAAQLIINPIDAKAWFPALSPRRHTLTYGDVVSEHFDLYGSIYTLCVVVRRQTQHATYVSSTKPRSISQYCIINMNCILVQQCPLKISSGRSPNNLDKAAQLFWCDWSLIFRTLLFGSFDL